MSLPPTELGYIDPRMRGFRIRTSVNDVITLIDARIHALESEPVPLLDAAKRVLAQEIVACTAVPSFDRAAMDGYALRGEETFGAGLYSHAIFRKAGIARPGRAFPEVLKAGEAVEIATGAPIPVGADTVVPVESTVTAGDRIGVIEPFPIGRHIGKAGEDVAEGMVVLSPGRVLRPQDLGVLSGLGVATIPVVRAPRVTIIITGDEILPSGSAPYGHRFADMNSPMLAALIVRDGGIPRRIGPIADDRETLRAALIESAKMSDAVLVSGGSSTGPEDHAPSLVAELGALSVHGVALRPASPSGLGFLGTVPILLLPGNPVSCLCAYDFFAGRVIRRLGGRNAEWPYRFGRLPLAQKLVSALGRVDYARVRLVDGRVEPLSVSGASILTSTTRADGFVVVPAGLEGHAEGVEVEVWMYDFS